MPHEYDRLENTAAYIAWESPRYAAVVASRLAAAVDHVEEFPQLGHVVPEVGDPAVRAVIHGA